MAVVVYTNDGSAQAAFQTGAAAAGLDVSGLSGLGQVQAALANLLGANGGSLTGFVALGTTPPTTGAIRVDASSFSGRVLNMVNGTGASRIQQAANGALQIVGATSGIAFRTAADGADTFSVNDSGFASVLGGLQIGLSAGFIWNGRSQMQSSSNGNISLYNNAATDFGLLQLGGTSASFPAIARSGAGIVFRLANDSADCNIRSANLTLSAVAGTAGAGTIVLGSTTATTVGAAGGASALPATPLGYIIANVSGTTVKIPYYNN